ncbi:ras GEF [Dendrothele bispora CBS 962.96]|uniref:Ras GEF n=1 Tax=Dendrothele bispora (strain CBS 962.96) TaxID=1314807 RepID=A0A4S8MLP4_DENBC|nr:ras GEF [Dendrothele bispora CBS 962.96]
MAAVATYATANAFHDAHMNITNMSDSSLDQSHSDSSLDPDLSDDSFPSLFCRALYDYEAQDASALSFRRGDIIEVLTQQPSGWWDGLLGDERGWFPSNYVTIISEEEAELILNGSDFSNAESQNTGSVSNVPTQPRHSIVDMSHAMLRGTQAENEHWLESELSMGDSRMGLTELANRALQSTSASDFWMPQVAPNGQIYYVNTKTGQQSRDLPQEAEEDTSDSDLAGLTSQSSSRSGTSAGLGFANGASDPSTSNRGAAGFGVPRRTGTPEPWIKKLADDGMSYYYYNQADGSVQWTRPEVPASQQNGQPKTATGSRYPILPTSISVQSQTNGLHRSSVYSDSSEVQPLDIDNPMHQTNGHPRTRAVDGVSPELTSAERIAQSLQQVLAPTPPELPTDLSVVAKEAIDAVIENIQINGTARQPEDDKQMDELIHSVVLAVRNLLYIAAVPTGQIPPNVLPKEVRDHRRAPSSSHSPLKPAQRKVTATLSRLVLSARAIQYDSGSSVSDTLSRIEVDAEELERAVVAFVTEVQRIQAQQDGPTSSKRLKAAFDTVNIGLGLPGAGVAGSWKGFGWLSLPDEKQAPQRALGTDVMAEVTVSIAKVDSSLTPLTAALRSSDENSVVQIHQLITGVVAQISSFVTLVADIHVARHVDIDGLGPDSEPTLNELYTRTVDKARVLVRTVEAAVQAVYDDCMCLFMQVQTMRAGESGLSKQEQSFPPEVVLSTVTHLKTNLASIQQTLEGLLSVGFEQADMSNGDYLGSIERRMSRQSLIGVQFGGALRPLSNLPRSLHEEDLVGMEDAFLNRPAPRSQPKQSMPGYEMFGRKQGSQSSFEQYRSDGEPSGTQAPSTSFQSEVTLNMGDSSDPESTGDPLILEEVDTPAPKPKSNKWKKILGHEAPDEQPWFLRSTLTSSELLIDSDDKTVKGGTVPALVERLTAHDITDPNYVKAFLMTFKSFTTLDELFDHLVARFRIQPPPKLTPDELEEWTNKKKNLVQFRVINTFKAMIQDDDVLEKEDLHILQRMKDFVQSEDAQQVGAARLLLVLIERAMQSGEAKKIIVNTAQAPQPILPRANKKLKLLDIEPLELARQLTMIESALYQKIRPMECLQRAREQKTDNIDNIAMVIQTSNRIADWVAESILSKEDSRRRAATVKHLIQVADRCRTLNNFSTMIAIISGLNTPPIRRLKRTWEQVSQRHIAQFHACEVTLDSNRNFNKYRSMLAAVIPPCVPFIGVFLSTLQFNEDGNKDNLPGNLINFKKRQKASEVISDIKRWQAHSYNFQVVPVIRDYIEESLSAFTDTKQSSERFWAMSLEREPREREDEKMARLLQESGFL